jgi:predicted glutamine amidotransferase
MCLIIVGHKDQIMKKTNILQNAIRTNNDGFGLMYFNNDSIVSKKTLSKEFSDIENLIKSVLDDCSGKLALHFRFATEGVRDKINTHPIPILSKAKDGRAISLMHNSPMLPTAIIDKDRSDTHQFVKYFLRPVLKSNPNLLYNEKWLEQLNRDCEGSRLVFADGKNNKFIYVNKKLWTKKDKVWFSNDNSFSSYSWYNHSSWNKPYSMYDDSAYDYEGEEDFKPKIKTTNNDNQEELFDKLDDDFLDLPLDEDVLMQMDDEQLAEYVKKNNNEVIDFLTEYKYALYQ